MNPNEPGSPEMHIPLSKVKTLGWFLAAAAVLFTVLGAIVSPRDEDDQPILLLADVRAVQDYRRQAAGWIQEMMLLDGKIALILADNAQGDVFTQSRSTRQTLENAVAVARSIDQAEIPPVGTGVHAQVLSTSLVYLEAARSALQWVSAPQEATLQEALAHLEAAREMRLSLEENAWLTGP